MASMIDRRMSQIARALLGLILSAAALSACGSDVSKTSCGPDDPCEGGLSCIQGICVAPDVGGDASFADILASDAVETDSSALSDVTLDDVAAIEDVATEPDVFLRDIPHVDFVPQDLIPDYTPPAVTATWPVDGQEGVPPDVVIRVEFSERIRPTTLISGETFSVSDANGNLVAGVMTTEPSEDEVTALNFTPTNSLMRGSPYFVELSPSLKDLAGNSMASFARFRFYIEPYPVPEELQSVVERYAPTIHQETMQPKPEYDYLSAIDLDGDWDLTNNVDALRHATSVPATVYSTVVETKSHWFITYIYYHPVHYTEETAERFNNDVVGAQVIVERFPAERPIALMTYFKTGTQEDIFAYVTTESGLTGSYVDGVYAQADLFPDGHFPAWISGRSHQSCLWIDRDNNLPAPCHLADADIDGMHFVEYVYKRGAGESVVQVDGDWPMDSVEGEPIGYDLEDILTRFWPRRAEVLPGGLIFEDSFTFASNQERDMSWRPGRHLELGSRFVNPMGGANFGRPPWAWLWRPMMGGFVDLSRGTFFLDPAWFTAKRFSGRFDDWDAVAKTGFSTEYCFNPFLNLNARPYDPECGAPAE